MDVGGHWSGKKLSVPVESTLSTVGRAIAVGAETCAHINQDGRAGVVHMRVLDPVCDMGAQICNLKPLALIASLSSHARKYDQLDNVGITSLASLHGDIWRMLGALTRSCGRHGRIDPSWREVPIPVAVNVISWG